MGRFTTRLPDFDLDEWQTQPHHRRLEALVRDRALHGAGTSPRFCAAYLLKLVFYVLGAAVVIGVTPGTGPIGDISSWWSDPIAYQKFAVWTLLWEILGLGCGSMPLNFRFVPPVGGFLYWLRPGTIRLPPWPGKVGLTTGTRRGVVDVALYVGVLAFGAALLAGGNTDGANYDTLPHPWLWAMLGCLVLLGLRDKTAFLAARPERYAVLLLVFVFPPQNLIFALKLCMIAAWWVAATSKLNRHFPFHLAATLADTPWMRTPLAMRLTRALWRDHPEDVRPSTVVVRLARTSVVVGYLVPLVLLLSRGGWLSAVAVTVMVAVHVSAISTFPAGAPLEWNVFAIYSTLVLFGHYAGVGAGTLSSVPLVLVLIVLLAGLPVLGSLKPERFSTLFSMTHWSGNGATSVWLFRDDGAEAKFSRPIGKHAPTAAAQLAQFHDDRTVEVLLYQSLALRAMHLHGRALNGLLVRAVDDLTRYTPRDGELMAGAAVGWNFGDGHLHDSQLLAAVQERCGFAAGQLRVITLEAQPIRHKSLRYRIFDAAAGKLEEGIVRTADLVDRQPWLDGEHTVPVTISFKVLPPPVRKDVRSRPRPTASTGASPGTVPIAQPQPRPRPRPMVGAGEL